MSPPDGRIQMRRVLAVLVVIVVLLMVWSVVR